MMEHGAGSSSVNKLKKCAGKDSLQRINYLYQASNVTATQNEASNAASQMYSNLLIAVSKKAVQRLDVELKRTICKGCRCVLLVGLTCRVKIKKKRSIWTCLNCKTRKTFILNKNDYAPWTLKDESVVEVLDYKPRPDCTNVS